MRSEPEWTLGVGIRRALLHCALWGTIYAALLLALLWLAAPLLNQIPIGGGRGATILAGLVVLPAALPAPWLLWHRMVERAGFMSRLLAIPSILTVLAVVAVGVGIPFQAGVLSERLAAWFAIGIPAIHIVDVVYELMVELE